MAWTQDDLDRIDVAIASGKQEVRFGDRSVKYFTLDELLKIRSEVAGAISGASGRPVIRQVRFATRSGF